MNSSLLIREELSEDALRISEIIRSAFKNQPHSNQKEHLLVKALRAAGALTLSLVAETEGKAVGHIAFSAVTVNGTFTGWYGLAPVSVIPHRQNRGIGSALIKNGLNMLKERGAKGCVLVGEPEYYKRFGFRHQSRLFYEGVPGEYFLAQPFTEEIPEGKVEYHHRFKEYA